MAKVKRVYKYRHHREIRQRAQRMGAAWGNGLATRFAGFSK